MSESNKKPDAQKKYDFLAIAEGRAEPHPSARLLGWSLIGYDAASGALACRFDPPETVLNPGGVVQGGVLAAMLDETMSPVIAAATGRPIFALTLEMKISFLRGARLGPLFGEGRLIHRGRKILFLEGRLSDADGALVAAATATAQAVEAAG